MGILDGLILILTPLVRKFCWILLEGGLCHQVNAPKSISQGGAPDWLSQKSMRILISGS